MNINGSFKLFLQFFIYTFCWYMHHLLFNSHQGVNWNPSITEESQLLNSITNQHTIIFSVYKHNLSQSLLLRAPSKKRSAKLTTAFRQFYQNIFSNKYLFNFKRVPVVIWVRNDSSSRQLVIANDISYSLSFSMVVYAKWSSHLLPKIFNFDRF